MARYCFRLKGLAAALSFFGIALPALADNATYDLARGQALAERLCKTCHLNPGQGEKSGASGIPGFRAVARRPGQTLQGLVAWLKSAPPMMPNHRLTQDEMFQLATYILSLKDAP
jgi:mono/diheme cytochrome c family protein